MEAMNYDLEERTLKFSKEVLIFLSGLTSSPINNPIISQLVRSATSVGANYREANDALGKKDFIMRMKISRKEAKEVIHWLALIKEANPEFAEETATLKKEATELKNILSSIISKVESK